MRRYLIGLPLILSGCLGQPEVVYLERPIDPELLTICPVQDRPRATLADVGLILTDYVEALDCANGKITAIAKTVGPADQ